MKERTAKTSQGWRRAKRRKCSLIRNVGPIVNDPRFCARPRTIQLCAAPGLDDASLTLAKCLRPRAVADRDETMVDEGLTGPGSDHAGFQSDAASSRWWPRTTGSWAPTIKAAASRTEKLFDCTKIR